MNKSHNTHSTHGDSVSDHAHALVAATADAAEEKVMEARNRLSAVLAAAKDTCAAVQDKAVQRAKATDKAIRANPYQSIGIALGVGALIGYLYSRRSRD